MPKQHLKTQKKKREPSLNRSLPPRVETRDTKKKRVTKDWKRHQPYRNCRQDLHWNHTGNNSLHWNSTT
ncbi:unnamed protein product [Brassica oleracea var. botrytis]